MLTKLGQFTKPGTFSTFQLFKLSQLSNLFQQNFDNFFFFLNIPSYPPPFAVRNSLTNQFYQKKNLSFRIFSTTKKVTSFSETLLYISALHLFFVENIQQHNFFGKNAWSMNLTAKGGGQLGIFFKKSFFSSNSTKNGNKFMTIKKAKMQRRVPTL